MYRHILLVIVLSALIVLCMPYFVDGIHILLRCYDWFLGLLGHVFSTGTVGNFVRDLLALLILPFLVGIIVAFIHWMIKKSFPGYFMCLVWVIWLIQTTAVILQR